MRHVADQDDASSRNRAYYDRAEVRRDYGPDRGLDEAEAALVDAFVPPGSSVLDLGCGNGRIALALAARGYAARGLDISPSMIDEARAAATAARADVPFEVGDAVALPYAADELDAVVFGCNGIGHLTLEGKAACLREVQRVLRPGGVAVLSLRTPYAANRLLLRMLRNVAMRRDGLRADEETDGGQYVQRPSLSWLVSHCRQAQLRPICVCSHRQAVARRFPRRTAPLGGQFYIVATA